MSKPDGLAQHARDGLRAEPAFGAPAPLGNRRLISLAGDDRVCATGVVGCCAALDGLCKQQMRTEQATGAVPLTVHAQATSSPSMSARLALILASDELATGPLQLQDNVPTLHLEHPGVACIKSHNAETSARTCNPGTHTSALEAACCARLSCDAGDSTASSSLSRASMASKWLGRR